MKKEEPKKEEVKKEEPKYQKKLAVEDEDGTTITKNFSKNKT